MKKTSGLFLYILMLVFSFCTIAGVSAQNVPVLGEMQSTGKVFIGSSSGKWSPAVQTYPLLQDTGIRTEDGRSSIFFRDGSRVDLSRDTIVSISGETPDYTIHLAKGIIAFSMTSASSLAVSTPSATISVNSNAHVVQKVGYEKASRILGVISATEKGTEVRSISGKIEVTSSATAVRTVSTGESIFVGTDNSSRIYKTQGVGSTEPSEEGSRHGAGALFFAGTAAAEGLVLYGLDKAVDNDDHHHPASPSSFRTLGFR